MKMGFLFTQMFWGIFLIIFGIVMIIKVVFGIHIPFMRLFISFLLIYFGITMLLGHSFQKRDNRSIIFDESQVKAGTSAGKYDIVFGSGVIEIVEPDPSKTDTHVEVNTVFGSGVIKIKPGIQVKMNVDAAFAGAHLPNGNEISFGKAVYQSPDLDESKPYVEIDASVVFGSLEIIVSNE